MYENVEDLTNDLSDVYEKIERRVSVLVLSKVHLYNCIIDPGLLPGLCC